MRRFGRTGLSICTCSTATLTPSTTLPTHYEPERCRTLHGQHLLTRVPKRALLSLSQGRRGHHGRHHIPSTVSRRGPRPIGPSGGTTPGALCPRWPSCWWGGVLTEQHDEWAEARPKGEKRRDGVRTTACYGTSGMSPKVSGASTR